MYPPLPGDLNELTVKDLRAALKLRGLSINGKKDALIDRLTEYTFEQVEAKAAAEAAEAAAEAAEAERGVGAEGGGGTQAGSRRKAGKGAKRT